MQRSSMSGLALVLLLAAAGCDASSASSDTPEGPDGAELYRRQSCAVCHGPHGDGSAMAPALRDLRELWTVAELTRYLADPKAYAAGDERLREQAERYPQMMPPYGNITDAQRTALAEHVLELSER